MNTFKNKNFKTRNYECMNKVCCVAPDAPDHNWIPCDPSELNGLTRLYIQGEIEYYGYL